MLILAAKEDFEIKQFKVKTAFLHGKLQEQVYMKIPKCLSVVNNMFVSLIRLAIVNIIGMQKERNRLRKVIVIHQHDYILKFNNKFGIKTVNLHMLRWKLECNLSVVCNVIKLF